MRLTKACEYGIRAMIYLATQQPDQVVFAREIAAACNIPPSYLAKVLQMLSRVGLVRSHQGASGGFILARAPEEIVVQEIVEAIDGPIFQNSCLLNECQDCTEATCPVYAVWSRAQKALTSVLQGITVAQLTRSRGQTWLR